MRSVKKKYTGNDLAIMIPTRDRPAKMRNLLDSLAAQSEQCGRIIVVASGDSIEELVLSYSNRLPVEYYYSKIGGQILQRNMAIAKLDKRTQLVISFDDDIVLEEDAIREMVSFWNRCEPETAGVSFNIVNNPPYKYSRLKALFGMSSRTQGIVLPSGYNIAMSPVTDDIRPQWLCGGATVWRREILRQFPHREVKSRWAICEDVMFSYPIGKKFPLYVCSAARVRHEHIYDHTATMKFRYYGRTVTLWRLFFVEQHPELSRFRYSWMILGQVTARFLAGIFLLRYSQLEYAWGQVEGFAAGMMSLLKGNDLIDLLEDRKAET